MADGVEVNTPQGWATCLASKGDWIYQTTEGLTTSAQQDVNPEPWYRKTFCKERPEGQRYERKGYIKPEYDWKIEGKHPEMNEQSLTSLFPLKSRVIEVECTYKPDPRKRTAEPLTPLQMEFLQKYHPLARERSMTLLQGMPNPTPEQVENDPLFDAIWQVIKTWDVNVPEYYSGYCGASGSHVALILSAINASKEVK